VNGESRLTFDGATLTVNPTGSSTASTIAFGNGDNATLAAYYSMNFQVNSSNTQSGRTYNWNKAGTGYGNGSNLMSLAADTNVLYVNGSVNSKAYSAPGNSNAGTYQYGLTNSPTWNVNQGSYTNNNSTAPDGSTTAATYTLTVNSWDLYQTIAVTSGVVYRVGVWVKLGTATNFCIVVNNTSAWNTVSGKAFNSSDGLSTSKWTHVSLTFTGPSTGNINLHIGGHSESITQQTAGTVFVWNWEVTTGNSTWISNIDDEVRLPSSSIFTSRGLLGLGTTSPSARIHVSAANGDSSGTYYSQLRIDGTGTYPDNIAGISLNPNGAVQSHIRFFENGTVKAQLRFNAGNTSDNKLKVYSFTTNTDIFTWDCANGNVGIGTASPGYKLDVSSGGIRLDAKSALTDNAYFVGAPSHGFRWNSSNDAFNNVIMYDNGNMYVRGAITSQSINTNTYNSNAGNFLFQFGNTTSGAARTINLSSSTGDPAALATSNHTGITWGTRTDSEPYYMIYCPYTTYGTYTYNRLTLAWHTGIQIGAANTYGGTRFYNNSINIGTQILTINDGDNNLRASYDIIAYASDRRLKENIINIPNALDKVMMINGVHFDWKEKTKDYGFEPDQIHDVGVIAQEIQEILPEIVTLAPFDYLTGGVSKSEENFLTVKYEKLTPLLIEAIKELNQKIEAQQTLINSLLNKDN